MGGDIINIYILEGGRGGWWFGGLSRPYLMKMDGFLSRHYLMKMDEFLGEKDFCFVFLFFLCTCSPVQVPDWWLSFDSDKQATLPEYRPCLYVSRQRRSQYNQNQCIRDQQLPTCHSNNISQL